MFQVRTIIKFASILAILIPLTSCKGGGDFMGGGGTSGDRAPAENRKTETFNIGGSSNGVVDLVFLLDTSDSMKEELASVLGGLQGLVDTLSGGSNGFDYQVLVVGNASKLQVSLKDPSRMAIINSEVNSHSALWNAYHLLEGNTAKVPTGALKLRPNAVKELIVLSDDKPEGITAQNFSEYLLKNKAKTGDVHVNGFVGTPASVPTPTCSVVNVGSDYITLANDPNIGGFIDDVCTGNWSVVLARLAEQIRARQGKQDSFTLKAKPTNPVRVSIDGQVFGFFTYDGGTNRVILDMTKLSPGAHRVDISY